MFTPHPAAIAPAHDEAELTVPAPLAPRRRAQIPWLASSVPVIGAIVLWQVVGSPTMLWFAAIGPFIALAAAADGARGARRERRENAAERQRAVEEIDAEIGRRHDRERADQVARFPSLGGFLDDPAEVWRIIPGRTGTVVLGHGAVPSSLHIGGDDDALVRRLRARAGRLENAPIAVPLTVGIAVRGPRPLADAVVRALALQVCAAHPPGAVRVIGAPADDWCQTLPHRIAAPIECHLEAASAAVPTDGHAAIVAIAADAPAPPSCAAVMTLEGIDRARLEYAGRTVALRVEAIGAQQAVTVARALARRHEALPAGRALPDAVDAATLAAPEALVGLRVALGRDARGPVEVDLVADGPHAIVAGMTGAGKSELLVTWVAQLCAARSTTEVSFLLADFKGGTAFDVLAGLPHVAGVLTDLDAEGAQRALDSLRAEVRHRERVLADAGARDIDAPHVDLPRLVIVVDEFAALLDAHRELGALFADLAARGRGLGMHLVLGTQRAAGVIRDALLANCPLRISLRVVDEADSRFLLGVPDAAQIPGDAPSRGIALVRRAGDVRPAPARIARTTTARIAGIRQERRGEAVSRRPWQPPLPTRIPLTDLPTSAVRPVLGLADQPEQQRQRAVRLEPGEPGVLVVGGPGSGKTTALAAIAAQRPGARWVPSEPEAMWDALHSLADHPDDDIVLIDDLDALLASVPSEYAAVCLALLERVCRSARSDGRRFVISVGRLAGPIARLADLLPRRVLLRVPHRIDHLAAGGDAALHDPTAPPGRGTIDGMRLQLPLADRPVAHPAAPPPVWDAQTSLAGVVIREGAEARRAVAALAAAGRQVVPIDGFERAAGATPVAVVAEPEAWQRAWTVLQAVRARGDLMVDAACGVEYRLLTGDRSLPPYCAPGEGRGWLLRDGAAPRRILLPGVTVGHRRRIA